MMTSVKSTGLPLLVLVLSYILYVVYAQPNMPCGCELKKNITYPGFSGKEVYQCHGCCFSTQYPTTVEDNNGGAKNFTLEATCCVPDPETIQRIEVPDIPDGDVVYNHTSCSCSVCEHIKE